MRYLGLKQSGGLHSHIKRRIEYFNIDVSHFTGRASSKGKVSPKRKRPEEILILETNITKNRTKTYQLIRAMLEIGVKYECSKCKNDGMWNGKKLSLHVDHIDGNAFDNRVENLRFLCPNCHSQTKTFCRKKGD